MALRRTPDYNFSLQSFPTDADTGTDINVIDLGAMDVSSTDDNTDEVALSFVSSEATDKYYSGLWWVQSSPVSGVNFTMEAKPYASYTVPDSALSTTGEKKGTRNKALSVAWESAQNKSAFVYLQANAVKSDVKGAFDPTLDHKYNSFLKILYYENEYSIRHDIIHGEQSRYTQLIAQDILLVKNGYEVSLGHVEGALNFNFNETQIEAKVGFPKTTVLSAIEERSINFSGQMQNVDPSVIALLFDEALQYSSNGTKLKLTNNVGEKKTYEIIIRGINKAKEIVEWRFPKCQLSLDGTLDIGKKQSYLGFKGNALVNEDSGDNEMAELFWAPYQSILITYPIKYSLSI
jgi:hypothetical protein